jgi:hypothetical protein
LISLFLSNIILFSFFVVEKKKKKIKRGEKNDTKTHHSLQA